MKKEYFTTFSNLDIKYNQLPNQTRYGTKQNGVACVLHIWVSTND